MPVLNEEDYRRIWEASQRHRDQLEKLQERGDTGQEDLEALLEEDKDDVREIIDELRKNSLVNKRLLVDESGQEAFYRVSYLGREALEHSTLESYLEEMRSKEDRIEEMYGGP